MDTRCTTPPLSSPYRNYWLDSRLTDWLLELARERTSKHQLLPWKDLMCSSITSLKSHDDNVPWIMIGLELTYLVNNGGWQSNLILTKKARLPISRTNQSGHLCWAKWTQSVFPYQHLVMRSIGLAQGGTLLGCEQLWKLRALGKHAIPNYDRTDRRAWPDTCRSTARETIVQQVYRSCTSSK